MTDAKQLEQWWRSPICETTSWELDPRPGGQWGFETSPASQFINGVNEYKCRGEILDYMPGRFLVYTWIANWNDKPDSVTVVTWDLKAIPGGTRVRVTHSGLASQPVVRDAYRSGWPGVVTNLKKFVEQ